MTSTPTGAVAGPSSIPLRSGSPAPFVLVDLLELTGIDGVVGASAGVAPDPATPILTQDHVRPEWRGGRLVLALVPAVGGTLAPFEVPKPAPCRVDHT